jgi:hypothetical protein
MSSYKHLGMYKWGLSARSWQKSLLKIVAQGRTGPAAGGLSLHSPRLGAPLLAVKRLLRKLPAVLRTAALGKNFPPRSLDSEPPTGARQR